MTDHITCRECGAKIDDNSDPRKPCPECGSTQRVLHVEFTDKVKMYDSLSSIHRNPKKTGRSKTLAEDFNGYEFSRSHQKMVAKQRLIDRENNTYSETVTDIEAGEVIHQCKEPLSQHRDHGMTKKKAKSKP